MLKKLGTGVLLGIASLFFLNVSTFAAAGAGAGGFSAGGQNTTYNPTVGTQSSSLANDSLITTIKTGINWILGLLGLIALCVLLWGGFQMVTAAGDDGKYKAGFTILRQAGIGLIFIGVSWLFVSLIFFILGSVLGV